MSTRNAEIVMARSITRPPPSDGNWSSPPWHRCKAAGNNFTVTSSNIKAAEQTLIRACYDREALYVGIECFQAGLDAIPALQRGWDPQACVNGVDIYLGPRHDHMNCVGFTVNPDGGMFHTDRGFDGGTSAAPKWYTGWQAFAHRSPDRWSAVFRIPFGHYRPRPGTVWSMQVSRNRDNHYNSSTWTPTSSWYHSGAWFTAEHGRLVFGPASPRDLPDCCRLEKPIRKRATTFSISATVDPSDDLLHAVWDERILRNFIDHVASWGIDRLYWIDYGTLKESILNEPHLDSRPTSRDNYHKTFENFGGDLMPAVIEAAHRKGLQFWPVFKPWDLGFDAIVPADTELGRKIGRADRMGGRIHAVTPTSASHPEMCMHRIPTDVPYRPGQTRVAAIRFVKEDAAPSQIACEKLDLWVSRHNHDYRPYEGPIRRRESLESLPVRYYDPRGMRCDDERRTQRVIILDGLDIPERYITIVCGGADTTRAGTFRNRAYALVECSDMEGKLLPFLYGCGLNGNYVGTKRGCPDIQGDPERPDWREAGITFAGIPNANQRWGYACDMALDNASGMVSLGLGKDDILYGAMEPSEPAAREHWLGWAERALKMGVDGYEIRIRHHMGGNGEWEAYGFGPGLREEYRRRTGVDPLSGPLDYALVQKIRGDGWLEYVRQAAARVRAAGKKISHELIWYMALRPEERCRYNIAIEWERLIRERMVDEVSLKGVVPFTPVGRQMLRLAHEYDLPVRVELHQEPLYKCAEYRAAIPDMVNALRRMGVVGLSIYETAEQIHPRPDGTFESVKPGVSEFWQSLGRYFRRPGGGGPRPVWPPPTAASVGV